MPQKDDWIVLGGAPKNDDDWQILGQPTEKKSRREPTWGDSIITGGLRAGLPILGGLGATALTANPLVGMGVGGGLSGIGETAAEWYERNYGLRDDYNPLQIATQTALGVIPGFTKAPGVGAGVKELLKYAGKAGIEGGILNAASEFPTQLAETGELPSAEQVIGSGIIGAGFGSVLGGGLGYHGSRPGASQVPTPIPVPTPTRAHVPITDLSGLRQHELPLGLDSVAQQQTLIPHPINQFDELSNLGVRTPEQTTELDALRQHLGANQQPTGVQPGINPFSGRFRKILGEPVQQGFDLIPSTDETGQMSMFGENIPPRQSAPSVETSPIETPPVQQTPIPTPTDLPQVVSFRGGDKLQLTELIRQGYVPWPGHTDAEGFPQLILKGANTSSPVTSPRGQSTPDAEGNVTFNADEGLVIPRGDINDRLIADFEKRGLRLVGEDPVTKGGIFRRVTDDFEPQEMRVPGQKEGNTGLENIALGGADPRVWDVMGSSLYSRKRSITTVKELLQNAWDEHKEIGATEPVRVLLDNSAIDPRGGTTKGKSVTVRDRGRGLLPEQIYTVLSNLGATGKAGVTSAAGGFGLAKAAPFTGGKHVSVRSVVDTPAGRRMYTFEGTPSELKNQAKGVPLNEEMVGPEIPTGLEVTTFYDSDTPFYDTATWAENMAQRSPSVETPTKIANVYGTDPTEARRWLDETSENPIDFKKESNYIAKYSSKDYSPKPMPTLMDTIKTPGADVNIHYDIEPGSEASQANLHLTNKGMYQGSNEFSYGQETSNVPSSIVADIVATVEEGHEAYPFSANREQIHDDVQSAIDKWVRDNIITGVTQKRVAEIQRQYDNIAPLPSRKVNMDYLDDGNLLSANELDEIINHPQMVSVLNALKNVHEKILEVADTLGWTPQSYGATWKKPSERLKKFGLLFQGPSDKGTTLGIHIPRPDDLNNSAILFNLMEHLNIASAHDTPIDELTTTIITTLAHEHGHIPGGSHDKGHSYRDADLRSKLGANKTVEILDELEGVFDDGTGQINPEILRLLQIYNESRERATSGANALLATGVSSQRLPNTGGGTQGNTQGVGAGQGGPESIGNKSFEQYLAEGKAKGEKEAHLLQQWYDLSRGLTTTADLSAPMRQGLPLIATKAWWTSWVPMVKALGSEQAFQNTLADIKARPMFQSKYNKKTNKIIPSVADEAGMKLSDISTRREEALASTWAESGGMLNKIPGAAALYKKTAGRVARASNRAYTAYLNQLRADTFESLMKDAQAMSLGAIETGFARPGFMKQAFNPSEALDLDPFQNKTLAKELADFINTATGRGPLKTQLPSLEGGKLGMKEQSLERNAKLLTNTLFSPRLFASRVRMLNPATYMMATPMVRKQYLKAFLATAGAWGTISGLAKMGGAEVSTDTNSADFGKIRFGNTRLDPAAGFQQYIVAASRLISGHTRSSRTEQDFELGQGYRAETRGDIAQRFMTNKLHPIAKFANDLAFASKNQPFHVADRTLQLFVPLIIGDLTEIMSEDPTMLPLMAPVAAGMGTQTYGKGESVGKFIDPKNDITFEGGELFGN